jgi:hypothetical protein
MSLCAVSGHSELLEDSFAAGKEAIANALAHGALPAKRVIIVFVGAQFDVAEVARGVRSVSDAPLIGCTTLGEATDAGYTTDSVSVLVLASEHMELGLGVAEDLSKDPRGAVKRALEAARAGFNGKPRLAITFPDAALSFVGEQVVDTLHELCGRDLVIAGGAPGDGGAFVKTYQIANDRVLSDSIPILLLGGDVDALIVTRSGFQPMGTSGVVTRSEGGRVYQIDHKPAIELVRRYVGEHLDPDIMATFPFALLDHSPREGEQIHYVIRSPFFYDAATDSIALGGRVDEGCRVQLGRSTREHILASADAATASMCERLGGRRPVAVLFASCGARTLTLGASTAKEVQSMIRGFGEGVPIIGFYSYGELGAFDSSNPELDRPRFHNCTLVECAIVERA